MEIASRFDLLAVQEVGDNLAAIQHLHEHLGSSYDLLLSDVTGAYPGQRGNAERLAYLYRRSRIERTELASDITIDRSEIYRTLKEDWDSIAGAMSAFTNKEKTEFRPDRFINFIRAPHIASFAISGKAGANPLKFLAVNAHLLYGTRKSERREEFFSLLQWLYSRAKYPDRMYAPSIVLLGDLNFDLSSADRSREFVDSFLKSLNETVLKSRTPAVCNFPLLTEHPVRQAFLRTNARQGETYDQIAFFSRGGVLPGPEDNEQIASAGISDYYYDVFSFTDLFADALFGAPFSLLEKPQRTHVLERCEWDVSDHMPAWVRLRRPE